ncbi:MAG: hypothetical protein NT062_01375, partial [Proteobacteria bacterium]|nr:hypothetical protein [Pseudomonadota bacterium]
MRTTVPVFVAFALAGGGARADLLRGLDRLQGGTTLHYELTGLEAIDTTTRAEGEAPRARELILAGVRLHGFFATGSTVNYATGLALAAGATIDGRGFAYDVALFPVGVAVRSGRRTAFVSLSTGVGAIG